MRHVAAAATLRGKVERVMLSPLATPAEPKSTQQRAFDEANAAYYAGVDWALDIREAEFEEADLRRVPAHLIRRGPETQRVVTREPALRGDWRKLDLSRTARRLRDAGVAEPD